MTENYYERLGVGSDADTEEIERAYREKAATHHPDVSDDPTAEDRFKQLKQAKEVLTDEATRRTYDRLGHDRYIQREHDDRPDAESTTTTPPQAERTTHGAHGFDRMNRPNGVTTLFDQFFRRRPDPRRTTQTTAEPRDPPPQPGSDLETSIEIDLTDAYHGAQTATTITRADPCGTCDGTGHRPGSDPQPCSRCTGQGHIVHIKDRGYGRTRQTEQCDQCTGTGELPGQPCPDCNGTGRVHHDVTVDVDIPAGIATGHTVRVTRAGDTGLHGGDRGDLVATIEVTEHEEFTRKGQDLYTTHPVSFPDAALGATVEVPTPGHPVPMSIPTGTQTGEQFRLSGEGMPAVNGLGHGDLYVRIHIVTPDDLTAEQRSALQAFAAASPPDPPDPEGPDEASE